MHSTGDPKDIRRIKLHANNNDVLESHPSKAGDKQHVSLRCRASVLRFSSSIGMHFNDMRINDKWKLLRRTTSTFQLTCIPWYVPSAIFMPTDFACVFCFSKILYVLSIWRANEVLLFHFVYVCGKRRRHTLNIVYKPTIMHIILKKTRIDNH